MSEPYGKDGTTQNLTTPGGSAGVPPSPGARIASSSLAENLVAVCFLFDIVAIVMAQVAAFYIRFHVLSGFGNLAGSTSLASYAHYIGAGTVLMVVLLGNARVYERLRPVRRLSHVYPEFMKSIGIWLLLCSVGSFVFSMQPTVSRLYLLIASCSMFVGLAAWRFVFHEILERSGVLHDLALRVVFVGWTEDSGKLMHALASDPEHAHEVVGCIPAPGGNFVLQPPETIPVLGDFSELEEILDRRKIHKVVINDLNTPRREIIAVANLCEKNLIDFHIVPSFFRILISGLHLETLNGVPVLAVNRLPLDKPVNLLTKRMVDVVGSLVGLAVFGPVIMIFAVLVRIESPGNPIYRQRRTGRRGDTFDMFKIRSMRLDAESDGQAGWTTENDPRCLRIGRFMRKWNIDELPQFWNVFKGEMSLVGPRPERPEHIATLKDEIPHYNARLNAKPGITGLAQIRGLRGDTDLVERIKSDLYYLENWTLILDFQILMMTVLARKNAY